MPDVKEFRHQGRTYRIIGRNERVLEYGYAEPSIHQYNILQVKLKNPLAIFWNLARWQDVEKEFVPNHVWISVATLGDTGGWKSALFEKCRTKMGLS